MTGEISRISRPVSGLPAKGGSIAGAALEAAGSIPVTFAEWGIKGPAGYGFFASLANHGTAEYLVSAHRL